MGLNGCCEYTAHFSTNVGMGAISEEDLSRSFWSRPNLLAKIRRNAATPDDENDDSEEAEPIRAATRATA